MEYLPTKKNNEFQPMTMDRIGNFSLLLVAATEAILPKSSYPPSPCPIPAPNPLKRGKLPELFQGKLEVDFQYHTRFFSFQHFFRNMKNHLSVTQQTTTCNQTCFSLR